MKKILLFASLLLAGMTAWAQDASGWEKGQDVTGLLQWKATTGITEDIDDPAWQGFSYKDTDTKWEFRDGEGGERDTYFCWGVYDIAQWNVYQEFEIPAGVYTVKVAGAYREGSTGPTFDLWKAGKKTNNAFLYVKVGEDVYEAPLMYIYQGAQQEALYDKGDGQWYNDNSHNFVQSDGSEVKIYGPSCHNGADEYIKKGNWNYNEVLFIVPEKMTITVGIDKRVAQNQDQVWWDDWRMIFEMPYDAETSAALVAYNDFQIAKDAAVSFAEQVQNAKMGTLGAIMYEEVMNYEDEHNIKKTSPLADIQAAVQAMKDIDARNRAAYAKTQTMKFVIEVSEGILKVTDYKGKADFTTAINTAKDVLYDEENLEATVQDYLDAGEALNKARIAYLLSQDKGEDGGYDFTHAVSNPWFVNQEYTPTFNGTNYTFSDELESTWFNDNVVPNERSLETNRYVEVNQDTKEEIVTIYQDAEGNPLVPISDKAHWTTDEAAEAQWIYKDTWGGWHGGFSNSIMKIFGYPAWYSAWAGGPNESGAMTMTQKVNEVPAGFYILEGYVYAQNSDSDWDKVNQYMFINDAEGNELTRVKNTTPGNFWGGFGGYKGRDGWVHLVTDFVQIPAGQITIGFSHNTMSANSGVILKYYGEALDYSILIQKKIDESKPEEGELWGGDLATYNAMIAAVKLPVADADAYAAALAQVNEAIAFKDKAAAAVKAYNLDAKYTTLMNDETFADPEDLALEVSDILTTAQMDILLLGEGEDDSYTMIAAATDVFNAYSSYVNTYAKAKRYDKATDNKKVIDERLAEQYNDLKENVATVEKLDFYARQLTAPMNEDIFAEKGAATASEANPTDITSMLVNPSLAEGPKTGWTCEGEDCNPSINTYGRELAECWNQKPFKISQTLYAMPQGLYELRVRACYRDGGDPDQNMEDRTIAGDNQFAFLFAESDGNKQSVAVKNITEGGWEDPSFDKWWNANGSEEAINAGFTSDWDGTICILPGEESVLNDDDLLSALKELNPDTDGGQYPFDYKRAGKYYPASMAGFKLRISKTEDAYVNSVRIFVEDAQNLIVGFEKIDSKGGDWLIYDDFELFYLGSERPVGINNVAAGKGKAQYFSINGVRLAAPQKGLNIVKENGQVRKVYVK